MVMISGCLYLLLILHSIDHQLTAAAPVVAEGNGEDARHAAAPVGVAQVVEGPVGAEAERDGLGHAPALAEAAASLLGARGPPQGGGADEQQQQAAEVREEEEEEDRRKRRSESEEGGQEEKGASSEGEAQREEESSLQEALEELWSYGSPAGGRGRQQGALQRAARGYFPNIDLGLQDNEILPPLKGYKLYNQELARSGKKLKWQEGGGKNGPLYNTLNPVASDDDVFTPEEEDEEEMLTREEEEARARAEQEEIRRQVAEAQRNREEEAKLADMASDMLLQYMVKKQGGAGGFPRRKAILGNAVEDKRSEEVEDDDDEEDVDPQTIDKLIEISSKLHLPADDVVDIISDVGKKKRRKKKKKDSPEVIPRYRPLMPPPAFLPVSPYPAPRPPLRKQPAPYLGSYPSPSRKWYQDKGKMKGSKQKYWGKPPKQLLAYPSYPFYQKPYRAYYPVYFPSPHPKSRYFAKPALSLDDLLGNSMDYDFKPPKQWYPPWKRPAPPQSPYISNYILPHPRTYQAPPLPKPRPPLLQRQSVYYLPAAAMAPRDDEFYGQAGQQDSDEELENFMEKVYMKRRMY
ncbi:neurofilament medium polypeptide [Anguilla rostrata]|uniref:neurofilament medium polypeptide n=1 Tax=Anguilla rostrata TaxID=7938 RepID=UPI0030CDEDE4